MSAALVVLAVVAGSLIQVPTAAADPVVPPSTGTAPAGERARPSFDMDGSGGLSEREAMHQAEVTGDPVVATDLTSPTQLVTADPRLDQLVAQETPVPVRVQRAGRWVDIDPTLKAGADGSAAAVASEADIQVGSGRRVLTTVSLDGRSFSLRWPTPLPAPRIRGTVAVWPDVRPGIDLAVRSNFAGVEQYLVVRTAAAARDPLLAGYQLLVDAPGLTVSGDDKGFSATDPGGNEVFVGSAPRMWSAPKAAAGNPVDTTVAAVTDADGTDARSVAVGMDVSNQTLSLRPDRRFLTDPKTTFPVVIDPSLSALPTASRRRSSWTMVWSDGQDFWNSSSQLARVGYDGWSGYKKARVFYSFDTSQFHGVKISAATLTHKQVHSTKGCDVKSGIPGVELRITGKISSSTSWSHQPDWGDLLDTAYTAHGNDTDCPGYDLTEWEMRAGMQKAADGAWNTITLGLRSADEGDKYGWRKFENDGSYPVLSITYDKAPSTPAAPTVAPVVSYKGALYTSDSTPNLSAKVSDPDGGLVRADFSTDQVGSSGPVLQNSGAVSSGGTASVTSRTLTDGADYDVTALADDGYLQSGRGSATRISVDTIHPGAPTVGGPSTVPKVGDTVSFTFTGSSSDSAYYVWGLNTDTPSTKVEPAALGGPVTVNASIGQFGPQWVTVYALDRAGNPSATSRYAFKVDGTAAAHTFPLDGSGADVHTAAVGTDLTTPAGTSWGPGRDAVDLDGDVRDCSDKAVSSTSSPIVPLTTTADPLNTSAGFSLTAWVEPTADLASTSTANGYEAMAAALYTGDTPAVSFGYHKTSAADANPTWTLTYDTDGKYGGRTTLVTTEPVSTTGWTYLVGSWSPSEKKATFYVNGVAVGSLAMTTSPFDATRLMVGGAPAGTATAGWTGAVDEVDLYPGPLDDNQVNLHANAHRPTRTTC